MYPFEYAALKLNPGHTANQTLVDLDKRLLATGGAKLLGLIDGMCLAKMTEAVERLTGGPFKDALSGGDGAAPSAASAALRDKVVKLLQQPLGAEARKGMRESLGTLFDDADGPKRALMAQYEEAADEFTEAAVGALGSPALAGRWADARRKFVFSAGAAEAVNKKTRENALRALTAPLAGEAAPKGFDLSSLLLEPVSLPASAVDKFLGDAADAMTDCVAACAEIVKGKLAEVDPQATALLDPILAAFEPKALVTLTNAVDKKLQKLKLSKRVLLRCWAAAKGSALKSDLF